MIKWLTTWVMLCLLMIPQWWVKPAEAVWGVGDLTFDETNWIENAAQVTQTLELVMQGTNTLAKLNNFASYGSLITQTAHLVQEVLAMAGRMGARWNKWSQLFGPGFQIPCSARLMGQWNLDFDGDTAGSIHDAMHAVNLITDMAASLKDLKDVIGQAMGMVGQVQGLQTLSDQMGRALNATAGLQAIVATGNETKAREEMRTIINRQAQEIMSQGRMAGLYGLPAPACSTGITP